MKENKKEKRIDDDIALGKFFEIKSSDKNYVTGLNRHEIRSKNLLDYTGDFELKRSMVSGHVEHKTNVRFRKMDDFGSYKKAIDIDYVGEDVIFTGYVYKLTTPQFNVVKRSAYAKGANYKKKNVEYTGQKCYIPTSGRCFLKYNIYFFNEDYTEEFRDLIRN